MERTESEIERENERLGEEGMRVQQVWEAAQPAMRAQATKKKDK